MVFYIVEVVWSCDCVTERGSCWLTLQKNIHTHTVFSNIIINKPNTKLYLNRFFVKKKKQLLKWAFALVGHSSGAAACVRSLLRSSVRPNLKPAVCFIATVQFYLCDISNSVLTLSCRWFTLQRCGALLYWCHNTLSILSHFIDERESRALVIYFIELFLWLGKQRQRRLTGAVLILSKVSGRKSMMNSNYFRRFRVRKKKSKKKINLPLTSSWSLRDAATPPLLASSLSATPRRRLLLQIL